MKENMDKNVIMQREKLLSYLEDAAKTEADWEESVPYVAGTKRGQHVMFTRLCENALH